MQYLRHVDGLRTVAVLAVVLFHLDVTWAPGGFVGVDVFFVISGFLISSLILSEMRADRFTLTGFYLRRVRRILPALFATIAATLAAGALILPPSRLEALGAEAAAATLSVSNVYFWLTAGYFDATANTKPLLHTWSLSVEEQFYLIWPALLLLVRRPTWLLAGVAALMFAVSLAASHLVTAQAPEAAFYLTPLRMFEFALGPGCIAARAHHARVPRFVATILSLLGASLIGYAVTSFSSEMPFPGVAALAPCLGAGLLIVFADRSAIVTPALSNRVSVYIGKLSYSLYLVHWPILAFYAYIKFGDLSGVDKLIAAGLIGASTLLLYYLIERPFHLQLFRKHPGHIVWGVLGAAAALSVASIALWRADGWPARFSSQTQARFDAPPVARALNSRCFIWRLDAVAFDRAFCLARDDSEVDVLLLGDSHAAAAHSGLVSAFPDVNIMQANVSSCRATRGFVSQARPVCAVLNRIVFDEIIPDGGADYVILASSWKPGDFEHVEATLAFLANFDVPIVLFGPIPTYEQPLPEILFRGRNSPDLEAYAGLFLAPGKRLLNQRLRQLAQAEGVVYFDYFEALCTAERRCRVLTAEGWPMLLDKDHLSSEGSLEVMTRAREQGFLSFPPSSVRRPSVPLRDEQLTVGSPPP